VVQSQARTLRTILDTLMSTLISCLSSPSPEKQVLHPNPKPSTHCNTFLYELTPPASPVYTCMSVSDTLKAHRFVSDTLKAHRFRRWRASRWARWWPSWATASSTTSFPSSRRVRAPPIQHSTLNTQHSTLDTRHSTLNAQHSTLNTQHSTLNTKQQGWGRTRS